MIFRLSPSASGHADERAVELAPCRVGGLLSVAGTTIGGHEAMRDGVHRSMPLWPLAGGCFAKAA